MIDAEAILKTVDDLGDNEFVHSGCGITAGEVRALLREKARADEAVKALREVKEEIYVLSYWSPEPTRAYQHDCVMPSVSRAIRRIDAALSSEQSK